MRYYSYLFIGLIICLLLATRLSAQKNHLNINVDAGMGVGWWMHNYGTSKSDTANNLGWARSRFRPAYSLNSSVLYQYNKWRVGINVGYAWMHDAHLNGNNHRTFSSERIRITDTKYTEFWNYSGVVEYNVFQNERWELFTFHFELGTFGTNSVHPDRERFGRQLWLVMGLKNAVRFKYFGFSENYCGMLKFGKNSELWKAFTKIC